MRLRDIKYIGFKHQRENKQISDNTIYLNIYTGVDFICTCIVWKYKIYLYETWELTGGNTWLEEYF